MGDLSDLSPSWRDENEVESCVHAVCAEHHRSDRGSQGKWVRHRILNGSTDYRGSPSQQLKSPTGVNYVEATKQFLSLHIFL